MAYGTLSAAADAAKLFAIDLISGSIFTRVKMAFGAEGAAVDVSASNPLPVAGTVALDAPSLAALETVSVVPPTNATTTRAYAAGYRAALATGAATTFVVSGNLTLGASREVRMRASSAFWLRFATAGTGQDAGIPGANAAALSIPFDANQAEVVVVPVGTTHISVIAESAAGAVTFTPVA